MKLVSGSLLVALVSSAAWAAAPQPAASPTPVAAAQAAPAASGERIDLARRFVNLALPPERYMELMRAGASSGLAETLTGLKDGGAEAEGQADLDRFFATLEPVMKAQLPMVSEAYANAYAHEYSATELQQMIAFAQTPAGQHYLARREFVDLDPAVIKAQMDVFEAMAPIMEQLQKEKCAAKAAARFAAGDKKATCPLSKAAETRAG
jgi:hypothetical protein